MARPETDGTREMPKPRLARPSRATAGSAAPAIGGEAHASHGSHASHAPARPAAKPAPPSPRELLIVEDAVRLLQWGRQWHELGEMIARIAERPSITEVRRTLRNHRAMIERAAAGLSANAPA